VTKVTDSPRCFTAPQHREPDGHDYARRALAPPADVALARIAGISYRLPPRVARAQLTEQWLAGSRKPRLTVT